MSGTGTTATGGFELVCSRLSEFFAHRVPWHRRLWNIGTVLGLREVLEYADACLASEVPNTEGLRFVIAGMRRTVGRDPGVAHLQAELDRLLGELDVNSPGKVPRGARAELAELALRAEADYLRRWQAVNGPLAVEFTARALASHLLDASFSGDHLYRWLAARMTHMTNLTDLLDELLAMAGRMPTQEYEVFVPCAAPFEKSADNPGILRWTDGPAATEWLSANVPEVDAHRESAGFLITVRERDPWAAIEAARRVIARAEARVRVARPSNEVIRLAGWARIKGNKREYRITMSSRQVEIGSLYRQNAVYRFDERSPSGIDDALELASYMESPSTGAAITGGWSAIEGLLIRPGEGSHHLAADRLAALVACSLPRAELTELAYRHQEAAVDELAGNLSAAPSNYERVRLVEAHLRSGGRLALDEASDVAAQNRLLQMINDPRVELERVRMLTTESLRRLYNQRNSVVHAGSLQSVALSATIRTAFSLVGAGLDRIVHAQLESDGTRQPLALVARAETELRLVGGDGGRDLGALLN